MNGVPSLATGSLHTSGYVQSIGFMGSCFTSSTPVWVVITAIDWQVTCTCIALCMMLPYLSMSGPLTCCTEYFMGYVSNVGGGLMKALLCCAELLEYVSLASKLCSWGVLCWLSVGPSCRPSQLKSMALPPNSFQHLDNEAMVCLLIGNLGIISIFVGDLFPHVYHPLWYISRERWSQV